MECFFEGPNFLAINPDECIDCSMCVPECPVNAIVNASEIPPRHQHFIALNRELSQDPNWHRITRTKPALPEHEKWAGVTDKLALLRREP